MVAPSTVHEVESAIRGCKDLCILCVDSPELAPPADDMGHQSAHLLAHLSDAFHRLPTVAAGSGVHNWVIFQETRTLLSASWAWPAHLQPLTAIYLAAISRAVTRRRTQAHAAPPPPPVAPEHHPGGLAVPAPEYVQRWTMAVVRKHRRLLADALAYLCLKPKDEEDNPIDQALMADHIISSLGDSPRCLGLRALPNSIRIRCGATLTILLPSNPSMSPR